MTFWDLVNARPWMVSAAFVLTLAVVDNVGCAFARAWIVIRRSRP